MPRHDDDFRRHRPGYRLATDAAARDARDVAYDQYVARISDAWRFTNTVTTSKVEIETYEEAGDDPRELDEPSPQGDRPVRDAETAEGIRTAAYLTWKHMQQDRWRT